MHQLSLKAVCVLEMIAEGHSYAQIVECYPDLKYPDIFDAARESLEFAHEAVRFRDATLSASLLVSAHVDAQPSQLWADRMAEIKQRHPRAYERWTEADDVRLTELHRQGASRAAIAQEFQRQRSAIGSRLSKLGLIP